jgi:uncharacterized protein YjbJ (UPF0337 family)
MNKDNFEGGVRSAVGQGERFVGSATDDKAAEVRGAYNEVAGSAQSAWGSAKDAAKDMADSGSIPDMSRLRDDIAKLTQTVSDLAQKQVASSRDQVAGVVGAAGDSCRSPPRSRRTSSPPWKAMLRLVLRRTRGGPSPLRA